MSHIHQIGTVSPSYTYVKTDIVDLTQDPSIIERPDKFEILDGDPPVDAQALIYSHPPEYTAIAGNYTVKETDELIDCLSGSFTVTLLPAAQMPIGKAFTIKNSGNGTITYKTQLSEKIDDVTQKTLSANAFDTLESNGTSYIMIG